MPTTVTAAPGLERYRTRLRACFPALATSSTVFLDNAGGSQLPVCVIEAMSAYLRSSYAQLGGTYPESLAARRTVDAAHETVKAIVYAHGAGEVVLGASTSVLCNMLAQCYADALADDPDRNEIIVSTVGHESDVGPWLRLARRGFRVHPWRLDPATGTQRLEDLVPLLTNRTRVVAFPQVSNILGEIVDVAGVVRAVKGRAGQRARVVVDGVAFAPHRVMDVAAWGCDWYAYSTYKVYGPHLAALFGRTEAMDELTGPNHDFIDRKAHPYKFELGGASHEACAGVAALNDYLRETAQDATQPQGREEDTEARGLAARGAPDRATVVRAFETFTALELPLQARLLEWLNAQPRVRVWGPRHAGPGRVSTVSFTVEGRRSRDIALALNARGLGVRFGHFYSKRLCEELGLDAADGVVRVSLVHYNTPDEVERVIEAVGSEMGT